MDAVTAAAPAFRLPLEPYPGLRPFLDHEASLLFGRGRQVREVIEHLRETHFVAVIGGSGSGKSSLIHAGVVPELRSFGIPGAGDFWVPMVSVPGTNAAPARPGELPVSPVTRMASKFAKLLRRLDSPDAERARVEEIAALLRLDAGFSRLVDTYSGDLDVGPGPDPHEARLLFVIDQFEELFHFTNKDSDDARHLVERVIDHFFGPHERCYVVLTMRSEHLSDCASYLELPDAINRASYLVRRLDTAELRDAITLPAQRFLRLVQRQRSVDPATLPAEVLFDEAVLARLLRDVQAITHDPDHLPLLQHLLARMWEMACRREHVDPRGVPAAILPVDLTMAVAALDARAEREPGELPEPSEPPEGGVRERVVGIDGSVPDAVNVLRACLENWAEAIFQRRSPRDRARIESLLRRLAFKDPNTGMYTQQRIDVDDPRLFDADPEPSTRAALRALIEDPEGGRSGAFGFVGSVDYLYWDDDNPQRVTLKVSHESFIRGWSRFRGLVDREAERFEAFVDVLRRCGRWLAAGRPERLLLESADLDHFRDQGLAALLVEPAERAAWFKVLRLDRDGPRLAPLESDIDAFIERSQAARDAEERARQEAVARELELQERARLAGEREREAERQRAAQMREFEAERARVEADRLRIAAEFERAEALARQADADRLRSQAERDRAEAETHRAEAETRRAEAVSKRNFWLGLSAILVGFLLLPYAVFAVFVQAPVLESFEQFATARGLVERRLRSESDPLPGAAGAELGVLLEAADLVEKAKAKIAFLGNRTMRGFEGWLKPVADAKRVAALATSEPGVNGSLRALLTTALWRSRTDFRAVPGDLQFKAVRHEVECSVTTANGRERLPGSLFLDERRSRGLFVPARRAGIAEIEFYPARHAAATGCSGEHSVWSVPRYLQPAVLLDARVRFLALAASPAPGEGSLTLYAVDWGRDDGEGLGATQMRQRSVVTDPGAAELVRAEIRKPSDAALQVPEVKSVQTWREPGGIGVAVADIAWRILTEEVQPIRDAGSPGQWQTLAAPPSGSPCGRLGEALRKEAQPGFRSETLQHGTHCFEIQRGNPPPSAAPRPRGPDGGAADAGTTGTTYAASATTENSATSATTAAGVATAATATPASAAVAAAGAPDKPAPSSGSALAPPAAPAERVREQVVIVVYDEPRPEVLDQLEAKSRGSGASAAEAMQGNRPTSIASLTAFGRLARGPGEWVVGVAGPFAGWIALRRPVGDVEARYSGAPWSTDALRRIGREVHALYDPRALPAPAGSPGRTPPASSSPPR
ncbi:hypothetical protein [Piscinibacter koreensis]|uniref:Novel STAND NTPase 1 domain-containing protein n=1 Tax=Piscinibacter koreensis TaxID=2742824 RepID=A0A7Y6TV20_9BURK|nr:hypothetical protein [Schlegelella koreensis]NUZ04476.1 hypothetical protein [Schlegelella koreensis]